MRQMIPGTDPGAPPRLSHLAPGSVPQVGAGDDARANFELLTWWWERQDAPPRLRAAVLGVHINTIRRWMRAKRAPATSALLVDQLVRGPILAAAHWRGSLAVRNDWRPLIEAQPWRFR